VGYNVARAVGPALGGLVVALLGTGAVFILNALSFLGVMVVLYRWRRVAQVCTLPAEDVFTAMRAGVRYVRHAPAVQTVLLRTSAFILGGSALWALLPLVARDELALDATGYGIILGCLGSGAVVGGTLLPRVERRMPTDALLAIAIVIFALATAGPLYARHFALLCPVMVIGGVAWIAIMSTFNVAAQVTVPGWVRARLGDLRHRRPRRHGAWQRVLGLGRRTVELGDDPTLRRWRVSRGSGDVALVPFAFGRGNQSLAFGALARTGFIDQAGSRRGAGPSYCRISH
jgi:hypothetical protein